jgi:hypothetical protein
VTSLIVKHIFYTFPKLEVTGCEAYCGIAELKVSRQIQFQSMLPTIYYAVKIVKKYFLKKLVGTLNSSVLFVIHYFGIKAGLNISIPKAGEIGVKMEILDIGIASVP